MKRILLLTIMIFGFIGFSYPQTQIDCEKDTLELFIPKDFGKQVEGSSGKVIYCVESSKYFIGEIIIEGLEPSRDYMLTINGKPGQPGNECLSQRPSNVCYLDFRQIKTDSVGNCHRPFRRKLEPSDYDVKFFIKDMEDWRIVLYNNFLFFQY